MLDASAALAAVTAPATTQALAFTTPAAPQPGTDVTLDGSTSVPANGRMINAYLWTLIDSGGIAALRLPRDAATATIATTGEGTFTVRLMVTDSGNATDTVDLSVKVATPTAQPNNASSNSGGGGSLSWPWLLALGLAVATLRPRVR
jgi:hypothetical protein